VRIYLDPASIHNEMAKRHPMIEHAVVWVSTSNTAHWASLLDMTGCVDGPADIAWSERYLEDYYGFQIEILRLRNVDSGAPVSDVLRVVKR
jgi:hypothetical protein